MSKMELKITKKEQNPLFNRKELEATVTAEIVPSKQEVVNTLAEKFSVPVNAIRVLDIQGKFGNKEFAVRASIYPSQEERDKIENLTQKEKDAEAKVSEEVKPEEAPAEETKVPAEPEGNADVKTPAEEAIGVNPVEEANKIEEKKEEEDKKEKEKSKEEKLNETELQA